MRLFSASFRNVGIASVPDGDYYHTLLGLIRCSVNHCLCSIFIIDHALNHDVDVRVDRVLLELAGAAWRGVDTRLLIGGSRDNPEIRGATLLAKARADELGVDTRLAAFSKQHSIHTKLVIADNHILTGSHNWSRGMFGDQTQDSVLLESSALAAAMYGYFEAKWLKATRSEYDVSV
jgi:phosphatidylserine/phosphatidylglycerophosphate/cardiolipin synthase-like enzyme